MFYCYLGYGILVLLVNTLKGIFVDSKRKDLPLQGLPVTIIITAYNEEAVLEQKIKNTLAINYPAINFISFLLQTDPPMILHSFSTGILPSCCCTSLNEKENPLP